MFHLRCDWLRVLATHSSVLAWRTRWTEEPGGLQSIGSLEPDTTERFHFHFSLSCIGEGNGNPFQCSCLENPRDGDAWWAAVYGVAHSRTGLKWLSSSSMIDVLCQNGKKKNRKQCFQLLLDLIGNFIGNDCPFIVYKGLSFEKRSRFLLRIKYLWK